MLACDPVDIDIVLERPHLPVADRFDLVVGTNIFVYYEPFEQALAHTDTHAFAVNERPDGCTWHRIAGPAGTVPALNVCGQPGDGCVWFDGLCHARRQL